MFDIIRMEERHLSEAAALERLCFSMPWSENMLRGELVNPLSHYISAVDESGRLLGYAGMQAVMDEGYIANIAVSPAARRRGIASSLLKTLIDFGGSEKLSFLTLEVREHNAAALSLYRKHGFEPVGRRRNYYQNPIEDALLMTYKYKHPERNDSLDNTVG